jgi:luciferase family oxidoreductase group 1
MRLGILDFCPTRKGQLPYQSVHDSVRLAQEAEALGYSRYWIAEHHELQYAHHAPDILTTIIAGCTEKMRVGPAGMLLKLHTPMNVAKSFRLIEALFPGRIDLGIAGGEAEPAVVQAMRGTTQPMEEVRKELPERVTSLIELIRGQSPMAFNPLGTPAPPVWLLGMANPAPARAAAQHGTCFGFSLAHPQSKDAPQVTQLYRDEFRPSARQAKPEVIVAVRGLCAESEEEAWKLLRSFSDTPKTGYEVIGSPAQCREKMEAICERHGTDELVFLDFAPDYETRIRNFRLLAEELRLGQEPATAASRTGS